MQADEKLESLRHRIDMLKSRIELQKVGPEVDTARKILRGLEVKYDALSKSNGIFIAEATSAKKANNFSEEELSQKLGAIYWIFGSSYEETVSYKKYRIEFLQIVSNLKLKGGCLIRVKVHIYENDQPFMMKDAIIEFWKGWGDSTEVDDLTISCNDIDEKYNNFHWFQKIAYTLARTWNKYFQTVPLIEAKQSGLLETSKYVKNNGRY